MTSSNTRLSRILITCLACTLSYFFSQPTIIIVDNNTHPTVVPVHSTTSNTDTQYHGIDYEITTTNYGWNTPQSSSFSRRILSGEFFNATLAHRRYNASAWSDLHINPDPNRMIIAFMDIDTCIESNYPIYGAQNWKVNVESGHPVLGKSIVSLPAESCEYLRRAVSSPALRSHPDSRLILLDW